MSGLREAKKDRTKTQLLEAALALISRHGFEQTTINQIADEVQVSPRTLLRYFPTKEDVIVSWVEDGMGVFRDALVKREAMAPPFDTLLASARAMLASYQARAHFFLAIERVIATSPSVAARKQQMMEALAQDVVTILRGRPGRDAPDALSCDVLTGTVFAMIRATIHAWVAAEGRQALLDIFEDASSVVRPARV
ncbi:TetR/AcrR family transcriptional regulator [Oceanicella sp. SM1341]|uniref:TetR/AcrR family transcriptional regulator n=1 Tax=Oceanicella sp. SM1341 TaxID=1548889 RepID=UPI000E4B603E|nr:TetR/AcrR family transcriptional regulator [Oceanicella sp. SM1341]